MIQIAISLLALAAGVHLLIQVKQAGLSSLYRNLSWLVILLSLAFILCGIGRGVMHMRHMHQCQASGQCNMKEDACPYMKGAECGKMEGHGECGMEKDCCKAKMDCCKKDGGEPKACCKKDGEEGKSCSHEKGEEGKAPCCHKGMAADSTAKK